MRLMTDASEEKLAELGRLALLGPPDAECWVFEIPSPFVLVLADLADERASLQNVSSKGAFSTTQCNRRRREAMINRLKFPARVMLGTVESIE